VTVWAVVVQVALLDVLRAVPVGLVDGHLELVVRDPCEGAVEPYPAADREVEGHDRDLLSLRQPVQGFARRGGGTHGQGRAVSHEEARPSQQGRGPQLAGVVAAGEYGEVTVGQETAHPSAEVRGGEHPGETGGLGEHTGAALHCALSVVKPTGHRRSPSLAVAVIQP
jgi:hypothetical protein